MCVCVCVCVRVHARARVCVYVKLWSPHFQTSYQIEKNFGYIYGGEG